MRIAFHAPMKPPDHPVPSGDRQSARLLVSALGRLGHEVSLASRLSSWRAAPDAAEDERLAAAAAEERERILAAAHAGAAPELWLTYHLYHKAPDLLGPAIAAELSIPYVVVEASRAAKRGRDGWRDRFAAVDRALACADAVVAIHDDDAEGLLDVVDPQRLHMLLPFIDAAPLAEPAGGASEDGDGRPCRLLAVAMMRPDAKLASYRLLAAALGLIRGLPWTLEIVGDGPARPEVEAAFAEAGITGRVTFVGEVPPEAVAARCRAADVIVWPALKEAFGYVFLDAGAAGRPVVGADRPGVAAIVENGITGLLAPEGDVAAFAAAVAHLVAEPALRRQMGADAARRIARYHTLEVAAERLAAILDAAADHRRVLQGGRACAR